MADPTTLQVTKDIIGIISSAVSAIAIVVGGLIAWRRWGREAPQAPRADLSHEIVHYPISPSERLLHARLIIKNTGKVTLQPCEGQTKIKQVVPVLLPSGQEIPIPKAKKVGKTRLEIDWPDIAECIHPLAQEGLRIDSGETDELSCDFIIPLAAKAVFVYSSVCLDPEDRDTAWDETTFVKLAD